ncbi:hypothetical protein [Paralysiella testudinis]|uniref:Uncharacterized protein n=1 Tax=Paralysiella testudinis TaxID=2809020 RepID=A0A892ZL00_9NEIS|nr:hypothetical protein [Paralysiella testudinis]QRQ82366.1 hypothetical protein JQU52_02860 [Paralysiella testudinis]
MSSNHYKPVFLRVILACCFIIFIATLGFYIYWFGFKNQLLISNNPEHWSMFGDYMGGVINPIFGFASLIALLVTIRLQAQELAATREELKRSAKAQENSEKALVEQSEIFSQQQFETTFFALLDQINKFSTDLSMVFERQVPQLGLSLGVKTHNLLEWIFTKQFRL